METRGNDDLASADAGSLWKAM